MGGPAGVNLTPAIPHLQRGRLARRIVQPPLPAGVIRPDMSEHGVIPPDRDLAACRSSRGIRRNSPPFPAIFTVAASNCAEGISGHSSGDTHGSELVICLAPARRAHLQSADRRIEIVRQCLDMMLHRQSFYDA